jgi:hypothetical protein
MKVLFDGTSDYPLGPIMNLDFKKLENEKSNLMFYYGIHPGYRMPRPTNFKHNVYFETEEPNGFTGGQMPHERGNWDVNFWTKIINVCPYSAAFENRYYNTNKFVAEVYPFDKDKLVTDFTKEFDVLYVGGLHGRHGIFHSIVDTIKNYNYRFISMWSYPYVTHLNVSNEDKMKIWAKSKITVCANLLSENHVGQYTQQIQKVPNWQNNAAFLYHDTGLLPQMKPRITDAAISKSLILVQKDYWNVIATWFDPDKHFIYFEPGKLKEKLDWCLANWNECEVIVENMYNEFMNKYSTEKFYEKHLKEFDI